MKEMFLRAILTVDETMNTVTMILSIVSGILAIVAEFKIRSRRNKKSWVIKLIIIVSIIVVTCTVVRKNITQVPDIVGKDKMKLKEELNSLCKQMLPEYMQPIDFVFIDKMPLTANGKVDFHELEGIELSNRL